LYAWRRESRNACMQPSLCATKYGITTHLERTCHRNLAISVIELNYQHKTLFTRTLRSKDLFERFAWLGRMLDHVRGNGLRPHLKLKISSDFFFHLDAHAGKLPVMCNTKCLYY